MMRETPFDSIESAYEFMGLLRESLEEAYAEIQTDTETALTAGAERRVQALRLVDLKLLSGDLDNLIDKGDYKRFYMHRTGHWLGLDVHDAGEYKVGDEWTKLQPGMTLTVEPGLYIRPADDIPPALAGIGIRIEDDVRVTADGCDVYTSAPKTVAEIEEVMRHD